MALARHTLIGIVQAAEQRDDVGRALVQGQAARFDAGGGVEIVDGGEQTACLIHDLGRARAVVSARRPHILTVDHLGEADDRVEGRPQLVHELAERIRWEIGAEDGVRRGLGPGYLVRSEEHKSELQSLMRNSYAVFCLNKKNKYEQ